MQRSLLFALAAAMTIAATSAAATVVLNDDNDIVAIPSPTFLLTPSPEATTDVVSPSPAASPSGSPTTSASPGTSASPVASPSASPASSAAATRSASSVNCSREVTLCSDTKEGLVREEGRLGDRATDTVSASYEGVPSFTMTSQIFKNGGGAAREGDRIGKLVVDIVIANETAKTFVFPKREAVLDLYKDGKLYDDGLITKGPGFELTPKSKMTAKFERDIVVDGDYEWQAKTWYYEKK